MKTCRTCKTRNPNEADVCLFDGGELELLPDPRIGTLLAGRYVIEAAIGEGGMATVYRARHKLVDRSVAVKIMNPLLATDPVVRERFRREAKSAQRLAHPNIIEIFDQGDTEDGTSFIVMEMLSGESLHSFIQRGPFEIDRALHVMIQIARGIARAHDLEIIHRDVKPENIFLSPRDDGSDLVKLLDFGIAKSRHDSRLTTQGELFGTPQYMAPERIMGKDTGGSSDLYALGVVFFEMLTGRLPFDATDVTTYFVMHMNDDPPKLRSINPRVPEPLEELVLSMLGKEPEARPVDAHRVHQDLLEILRAREALEPPSLDQEAISTQGPVTLAAGPADGWARRLYVFEQMLTLAFGKRDLAPSELTAILRQVDDVARRLVQARSDGLEEQRRLERIDLRGREGRAQLGAAVDQLGVDVSKAKEAVRAAENSLGRAEQGAREERERYLAAHKDIVFWEGRSAFAEPWSDLSAAYRAAADLIDGWRAKMDEAKREKHSVESAVRNASDLDFQIRELRAALANHEQALDGERDACRERIAMFGTIAQALETELFELASRFCTPLKTRPELVPLFKELEIEAA